MAFGAIDRDDIFFFASDQVQGGGGGGFAEEEEEGDSDGVGESEVSIARVTSHDDVPLGHVGKFSFPCVIWSRIENSF